jgi:hypothetical protein
MDGLLRGAVRGGAAVALDDDGRDAVIAIEAKAPSRASAESQCAEPRRRSWTA